MTLNPKQLKELLAINEKDLKKYSVEQLRDMLGVFHYLSRLYQREINERENLDGGGV